MQAENSATNDLVQVENLSVSFATPTGWLRAVDNVSLSVAAGEVLGLVGESGSGKSVLARTLMGLTRKGPSCRVDGSVRFDGTSLLTAPEGQLRDIWGNEISMIFQDPMTGLNPVMKIGKQVVEVIAAHRSMPRSEMAQQAVALLRSVGIPDPERRLSQYPHQLSGGMRQRVLIACALACDPRVLIADEATTALDVTVQAQILDQLKDQQARRRLTMLFITHDLSICEQYADRVAVMYAGRIVEIAPVDQLFASPRMPYTEALLKAVPRLSQPSHTRIDAIPGRPPDLVATRTGCRFSPRCAYAQEKCFREEPLLAPLTTSREMGRQYACWFPLSATSRSQRPS